MTSKEYKEKICDSLEEPYPTSWTNTIGSLVGGFVAILIAQECLQITMKSLSESGLLDKSISQSQEQVISNSNADNGFLLK